MRRAKHFKKRSGERAIPILATLLLFTLFSSTCFPLSQALRTEEVPSLPAIAGQIEIKGALSARPEWIVETAPEENALPNDPYPLLYTASVSPQDVKPKEKVAYLTFDDGPSNLTLPLLDVLDRYGVKATFFLVGKTGEEDRKAMREIVQRGHAIGVHSYSHDYQKIYASDRKASTEA